MRVNDVDFSTYSLSRINSFLGCPQRAARIYLEGKRASSVAMNAGKAIEYAIEHAVRSVQEENREHSLDEMVENADAYWQLEIEAKHKWTEEVKEKMKYIKKTLALAKETLLPILYGKVEDFQYQFEFPFAQRKFTGIIDYVFKNHKTLADLKTSSRMWQVGKEEHQEQALIYPIYLFSKYPELDEVTFKYYILTVNKNPKFDERTVIVKREQTYNFYLSLYYRVLHIENMLKLYKEKNNDMRVFPANYNYIFCNKNCHVIEECKKLFRK